MRLSNFLLYTIFFPRLLFFTVEQRLKYWVKYLSFFICQTMVGRQEVEARDYFFSAERLSAEATTNFFVYFSVKKQFFYFLLLKFFFRSAVGNKRLARKKTTFLPDEFSSRNAAEAPVALEKTTAHNIVQNKIRTPSGPAFSTKRNNRGGVEVKFSRTLFFVTTAAQAWFIKNFFYKAEQLLIFYTSDLITNRRFFYKMLFGFHEERKNISFPRQAYKKSRFSSVFFYAWAGVDFFRDAFFFNKIRKESSAVFFLFFLKCQEHASVLFGLCTLLKFFVVFKKNIFTAPATDLLPFLGCKTKMLVDSAQQNVIKFFLKDVAAGFVLLISKFFLIYWMRAYAARDSVGGADLFSSRGCSAVGDSQVYFWRRVAFFIASAGRGTAFFYKNPDFLKITQNFYSIALRELSSLLLNFNFLFSSQIFFSRHVFDKRASFVKNPKVMAERQNLINKVMLLRFLPISLIVLFASSANKQILRDVFRFHLPTILISSMDNQKLPVDYSYPGNSFEFSILYFYVKFLLELSM